MSNDQFAELEKSLKCGLEYRKGTVVINDKDSFKKNLPALINKINPEDRQFINALFYSTWCASSQYKIYPSSFHKILKAFGNGSIKQNLTLPALIVNDFSFTSLISLFRNTHNQKTHLIIPTLKIDKSTDINYHMVKIMGAAIISGFTGALFVEATNIRFEKSRFENDRESLLNELKNTIQQAIACGIYNLDLDSSEIVEIDRTDITEQMLMNLKMVALATNIWIRILEPKGVTVSVGGKIGTVDHLTTTKLDLVAYLKRLYKEGSRLRFNTAGEDICKVTVNEATNEKNVSIISDLNQAVKREFGMGGIVLELGFINNMDSLKRAAEMETCEVIFSLNNNLRSENNFEEIIKIFHIDNTDEFVVPLTMEMNLIPPYIK